MLSFLNDYSEGAHPRILKALADTNLDQTSRLWSGFLLSARGGADSPEMRRPGS